MRNVFAIVKRDVLRLLRVPSAWIIILGLIFIPPLYAWFNVIGFWDPYGNTLNIHVAIANQDEGTNNKLMGKVNLGDQIVSQLKGNKQLGWQFVDRSEAMEQVESGRSYAAIVIPKDFSERLSGVVTGDSKRPQMEYYVNEKANAIATKVTDTGANTVDQQVNNTFVSTVSKVVSKTLNTAGDTINAASDEASRETAADLKTVQDNIGKVRSLTNDLRGQLGDIPNKTQEARQALQTTQDLQASASQGLAGTANVLGQTQDGINGFVASTSSNLDQGSALLSHASGKANLVISDLTSHLTVANGDVGAAVNKVQDLNDTNAQIIKDLEDLGLPGSADIIAKLKAQNETLGQSISNLQKLNADTGATISNTGASADSINTATQTTLTATGQARKDIISGALPQLNNGLTTLSSTSANLGAGLNSQGSLIDQTKLVLDQLDKSAAASIKSLESTDTGLRQMQDKLATLSTDLTALGSSNALGKYFGKDGKLDVAMVADFMLSPTVLDTKLVYPVASYGSGMAPLFVNLSLWVGAFMLMVIVKLEVDDDELDDPTPSERYWGRWLLLAPMAALQGLVTAIGSSMIGVQTASLPVFALTAMVASLVYLSITYALSTTFLHVGKGLCIVLVILQIPGASGLYPIEMMPAFFRNMYPFFPFTYSINALRETIGGFYGNHWLMDMGKLLIFAVLFFTLGLLGRPRLNNLNLLFARQIAESDMIVGEPVQQISHEFRLSQAISLLADRDEYRQIIERKANHFAQLYPKLKRIALVAGIVVPAILAVVFSFTTGTMLVALAVWIVWILIMIAFLMAIEMMRDNVTRQVRLGTLDDEAIRGMLYSYEKPRMKRARARSRIANGLRAGNLGEALAVATGASTSGGEAKEAASRAANGTSASSPHTDAGNVDSARTEQLPPIREDGFEALRSRIQGPPPPDSAGTYSPDTEQLPTSSGQDPAKGHSENTNQEQGGEQA
ncbi:hypothetical protein CRD60_04390 [Bifidobacterium aemilianum]|uniref:ABC-2 type transporter transmembrane domain-containing protein n=1 Tax=Bifidobacterium aemilianum TaxID=2493120 RepID=A0A366K9M9_9BIFI|nr:YhgE/Pip domain-containing protein [Bifidobacterium aemilianum]RBP97833.1 hypothetical protein CRD60_04390 [Bifidobacterium aemilianum]